jgi:hypothetical protein
MSTSGSYDFSMNRDEFIAAAYEKIGLIAEGQPITAYQMQRGVQAFNLMIKAWKAKGINLWKYQEMVLFLDLTSQSYDIGPSGDRATTVSDYVKTEISTAAVSGALTILVDSITGIAASDQIGIVQDDGTIHWTTVNGAPSGSTVTLAAALTDDVAVDNHVYVYTSKPQRPMRIIGARLHRADDTETPIRMVSRQEYFSLSNKSSASIPSQAYYDPQLTNGALFVYGIGETVNDTIRLTAQIQFEDFDSTADTPDFPQEWYEPIVYNLALRLASSNGISLQDPTGVGVDVKEMADQLFEDVFGFDVEAESVFLQPQMEE